MNSVASLHPLSVKSRSRLVLGFYRSAEHAEEALREIRRDRFRRSAVVHRAEDGRVKFQHAGLTPQRRAALSITLALGLALLGDVLGFEAWEQVILASGAFLLSWFATLWLGFGLQKSILQNYSRFVLNGESLVVVGEKEERATDVVAVLRRIAHPSVFVIRPGSAPSGREEAPEPEVVTMASLPDCAAELAASHQRDESTRSRSLLPTVTECEVGSRRGPG